MKTQALIITGFLITLSQGANAAGMTASASLLPPGYAPVAAPVAAPSYAPAPMSEDFTARSGMGEADLAPAGVTESAAMPALIEPMASMPTAQPATLAGGDYVDIPALAPMPMEGVAEPAAPYREGNFTFKR